MIPLLIVIFALIQFVQAIEIHLTRKEITNMSAALDKLTAATANLEAAVSAQASAPRPVDESPAIEAVAVRVQAAADALNAIPKA